MWNFQGLIKNELEFPRVTKKNNVEFQGIVVFGLGISKGSNTILSIIQGLSFLLSGISRSIVKKWKIPEGVQKNISSTPQVWIFSGIAYYEKGKSKYFWEKWDQR